MDAQAFLSESQNYVAECYERFQGYQKVVWGILDHLDTIFRAANLPYYLAFGSLLGAVRDKNPIPWDYDVDLLMKASDYSKLIDVLEHQLSDEYYYVYKNNMKDYPFPCLRVGRKGYTFMSFQIDIFFLLGCPSDEKKIDSLLNGIHKWANLRMLKFCHLYLPETQGSFLKRLMYKVYHSLFRLIPTWYIDYKEKSLFTKYPMGESDQYACFGAGSRGGVHKVGLHRVEDFKTTIDMPCGSSVYQAPEGYVSFLRNVYKSPEEYLPIKERFDEFYRSLYRMEANQAFFLNTLIKKPEYSQFK